LYELEMRNVRHAAQGGEEPEVLHVPDLAMAHRLVSDVEGIPDRTGAKGQIEISCLQRIPENSGMG